MKFIKRKIQKHCYHIIKEESDARKHFSSTLSLMTSFIDEGLKLLRDLPKTHTQECVRTHPHTHTLRQVLFCLLLCPQCLLSSPCVVWVKIASQSLFVECAIYLEMEKQTHCSFQYTMETFKMSLLIL